MAEPCSVSGCDKDAWARGWCGTHYSRWRRTGEPGPAELYRDLLPKFCTVASCGRPAPSRGMCPAHRMRLATTGDVQAEAPLRPVYGDIECSVKECDQPRRKRTWCASHYAQWKRTGEVRPFHYKWSTSGRCAVCGSLATTPGLRKYCSWSCATLSSKHGGEVALTFVCAHCKQELPLHGAGKNGRRLHSDTKLCTRCRQDLRKHGMSALTLVRRDGTQCGICGTDVDLSISWPDPQCPSVDHIIPRAKGGTNDPKNLQLAHMNCNSGKRDHLQSVGAALGRAERGTDDGG